MPRTPLCWYGPIVLAFILAIACSQSKGVSFESAGNLMGSGGDPADRDGFHSGGNASLASGGAAPFIVTIPTDPGGAAGAGSGDSCAATSTAAERVVTTTTTEVTTPAPVAVYIMQDQSLSMLGPKWTSVQQAISAFVMNPASAGVDVAIKFFAGSNANLLDCTGVDYQTPDVAMAPLPQNAQPINDSVTQHGPLTLTPIEPALRGGINFCEAYGTDHPGEKCVLVFITDGAPDLCDGLATDLAQIAADAKTKGVQTFTVGMDGADFNMLNAIAAGGGTDCTPQTTAPGDEACDVRAGTQAFVDALNTIRGTITTTMTHTQVETKQLACDFQIPEAPPGQKFDRTKVNVRLTAQGMPTDFRHVDSAAACSQFGNQGWYYDDPVAPTRIEVCPDTCSAIKQATGADMSGTNVPVGDAPRVDILLGCATNEAIR